MMNKRHLIGNISIIACIVFMAIGYWNMYDWYLALNPYGTLIAGIALSVTFFAYVDIKDAIKDPVFYLMVIVDAATLLNLFLVQSRYGALLTVFDLALMLYLVNIVIFSDRQMILISAFLGFFFFYWTFDVKGYFKGYNTNYGGLVLMTGFIFFFVAFMYLRKYVANRREYYSECIKKTDRKEDSNAKSESNQGTASNQDSLKDNDIYKKQHIKYKRLGIAITVWSVWMFAWGYNIISWYRARCALLGLVVFLILLILPRKVWEKKWLYNAMTIAVTVGAIAISGIYVWLGEVKDKFSIQIFYKDILSGREAVWKELWQEFLSKPITGIGSAYEIKLEWMEGVFEVHNGLLDILFVHGIFVFIVILLLLIKRLFAMRERVVSDAAGIEKVKMAGVISILIISFMENCFIVPPFLLCLMILMSPRPQ